MEPARATGLDVELRVAGDLRRLPPEVDLAAFRIAQEALTNVLRHACAPHAVLAVRAEAGAVEVQIVDDGVGGPVEAAVGHRLTGMRERAAAHGGTVEAGPRPGGGWRVRAVLPVSNAPAATTPAGGRPS